MPSGGGGNVRFGSQADMCGATRDVCFVPKADIVFTRQVFEDTAESTL